MPKTKPLITNRFEKIIILIWGTLEARNIQLMEFYKAIDISPQTMYRRKKNPEDFSIKELSKIGRYLNIPIEELRQCVMY